MATTISTVVQFLIKKTTVSSKLWEFYIKNMTLSGLISIWQLGKFILCGIQS